MSTTQTGTPAGPHLVMQGGVMDGEIFPLKENVALIIGSGRLADIQIGSSDVSSAHLKVVWDESGLYVNDNASFTGTFVNDEQVETAPLWEGDVIGFASRQDKPKLPTLLVRVPPGSVVVTAPPPAPVAPVPDPGSARKAEPPPPPRRPKGGDSGAPASRAALRASRMPALKVNPRIIAMAGAALLGLVLLVGLLSFFLGRRAPLITGVTPPVLESGQTSTIAGRRFGAKPEENKVRFGEVEGKVVSAAADSLTVVVPEISGVKAGESVGVTVEARGRRSDPLSLNVRLTPKVASLNPDVALPGETVVARGEGLDSPGLTVTVEERPAVLLEASHDQARFRIPDVPLEPSRLASVLFASEGRRGKEVGLYIGRLPLLAGVKPARADVGERVVLEGRGFSLVPAENRVLVGGFAALVVKAKTDTLDVVVPDVGGRTEALVVVEVAGRPTGARALSVLGPSTQGFRLRFFAGPVAGSSDRATVASALGPLVLLQGAAGGANAAERAYAASMALNAIADLLRAGKTATLEARTSPGPSVAPGGGEPFLRVLDSDVQAYETPLDLPASVRPAPQQLVDHWTALLSDYLAALVEGRRPYRLCAVTPRAGALVQALGQMGWKPGGGGVDPLRARGLGEETLRKLRELALVPAKPGQAIPALAVEGRWEGEATEAGLTKSARLVFEVTGSRLTGTLVLGGRVAMEVPIRDAVVEKDILVFSLRQARSTPVWLAKIGTESLEGEIHEGSKTGPVTGQFKLRFAP